MQATTTKTITGYKVEPRIVNGYEIRVRAPLQYANLAGVDLSGSCLDRIDLYLAKLNQSNLSGCSLERARLDGACLDNADLSHCFLYKAYLHTASLKGARLQNSDLTGADLSDSWLDNADLRGACLRYVNLKGASLVNARLDDTDITGALLPRFWICPRTGSFRGWTRLDSGAIIKVLVPAKAKRTACLVTRKCRAEYVKVLESTDERCKRGTIIKTVRFNSDIRVDSKDGVPVFLRKREAKAFKND